MPELAIIDLETIDAAQVRREASRARSNTKRKYDFLLAGHVRCSCGMGTSVSHHREGRYRYYQSNSVKNKRHARGCTELMIRAPDAEKLVWHWVYGLICDDEKLEQGLSRLAELAENNLGSLIERVGELDDEINRAEIQIRRLTRFISKTFDEYAASELKNGA